MIPPNHSAGARVGIFWRIPQAGKLPVLVTDCTSLAEAEAYGEFLTHPRGHYDVWEKWQSLGSEGLKRDGLPPEVAWYEYEQLPRGRVVFHVPTETFIIYADSLLHDPMTVARITTLFTLTTSTFIVKTDQHYQTR